MQTIFPMNVRKRIYLASGNSPTTEFCLIRRDSGLPSPPSEAWIISQVVVLEQWRKKCAIRYFRPARYWHGALPVGCYRLP
jgi:hypothetical protein